MKIQKIIKSKSLPSFCTANFDVLRSILFFCKYHNLPILIESTSNQVNQNGGYTSTTPKQFMFKIKKLCKLIKFNKGKILIGGDHLGPLPWKNLNSKIAVKNGISLIKGCLRANYQKIHIDVAIKCKDDRNLSNKEIFNRTKKILKLINHDELKKIFFVIGTEVPFPGGNTSSKIKVSFFNDIKEESKNFRKIFDDNGLYKKHFSLVVEPGMSFFHKKIIKPKMHEFKDKLKLSKKYNFSFEGHSSDYQPLSSLKQLVKNNFKFLKVGPEITYELSKTLFKMEKVERRYFYKNSKLTSVILATMNKDKSHWIKYYKGSKNKIKYLKLHSRLDRLRYYWNKKELIESKKILINNINLIQEKKFKKFFLIQSHVTKIKKKFHLSNFDTLVLNGLFNTIKKYYLACGFDLR